ncbi:hypothetical protein D3C85_1381840 [compost metagenome]
MHDLQAFRVGARELEEKVLAAEIVAAAQDVFDDFRHGLVLIEAELLAAGEQCQARLKGDFIAGFVDGAGQAFEGGDHAVEGAQRFDLEVLGQEGELFRHGVQAELGLAVEQLVGGEVLFAAGEFDDVVERLAELFFAVEAQDVEGQVGVEDVQLVPAVVEEGAYGVGHGQAFLV